MQKTESSSSAPNTIYHQESGVYFDEGSELHDPELYQPGSQAHQVETLADIGPEEIAFYREQGYLSVRQAFSPAEVQGALDGIVSLLMGEKPDFKEVVFEASARERLPELGPQERMDSVRKLGEFENHEPRLKALSQHPAMLAVIQTLLHGRRPEMFQDMALLKPPRIGREKPWHQDHAYFDYPLDTPVVGVWIALDEATVENGCMQILPGRHQGPIIHFKRRDWQICDREIMGTKSVAAPLPPGGALFFDGKLPHGTPHNTSPNRRRALQFHYAPDDIHKAPPAERLAHFGSEGKNVTC